MMSSNDFGHFSYAKYGQNITLDEPDPWKPGLVQRRKNSIPDIYSDTTSWSNQVNLERGSTISVGAKIKNLLTTSVRFLNTLRRWLMRSTPMPIEQNLEWLSFMERGLATT